MSSASVRSLQSWAYRYKRTWRGSAVSSILQPVLFLAAMGLGLGSLVNKAHPGHANLGGVTYLDFLAPALLAALHSGQVVAVWLRTVGCQTKGAGGRTCARTRRQSQ